MAGEADEAPQVIDGIPLIEAATKLKDQGNAHVKKKEYNEAVRAYEQGVAVLDKADGHPMLRQEVEDMIKLKSVLYCNASQCLLNLELYRRAVDSAASCLALDEANTKALHRRSLGNEALRNWSEALKDAVALQKLGGGGMSTEAMEQRVEALQDKVAAEKKAKEEESSEDECDTALVKMKERFDEIVEKYDLREGNAAEEVSEWLVSGEWTVSVQRVAKRWKMDDEDAEDFLKWIAKGLEFKAQNAQAASQVEAVAPAHDLLAPS